MPLREWEWERVDFVNQEASAVQLLGHLDLLEIRCPRVNEVRLEAVWDHVENTRFFEEKLRFIIKILSKFRHFEVLQEELVAHEAWLVVRRNVDSQITRRIVMYLLHRFNILRKPTLSILKISPLLLNLELHFITNALLAFLETFVQRYDLAVVVQVLYQFGILIFRHIF